MSHELREIAEQVETVRFPLARGAKAYRLEDLDPWMGELAARLRSAGPADRDDLTALVRDARFGTLGFGRGYACDAVDLFLDGIVAALAAIAPPADVAAIAAPDEPALPDGSSAAIMPGSASARAAATLVDAFPPPVDDDGYVVADIEAVVAGARAALETPGEESVRCRAALDVLQQARPRRTEPGCSGWDRAAVDAALVDVAGVLREGTAQDR